MRDGIQRPVEAHGRGAASCRRRDRLGGVGSAVAMSKVIDMTVAVANDRGGIKGAGLREGSARLPGPVTERRLPRWSELRPLLAPRRTGARPDRAAPGARGRASRDLRAIAAPARAAGRCSTTPTAPPTTELGLRRDARGVRAGGARPARAARTSRRSTRPTTILRPARRDCRWPSRRRASRGCSTTRASARWRGWRERTGIPTGLSTVGTVDARGAGRGGGADRAEVVPALPVARPRRERRADRARAGRRLPRRWRSRSTLPVAGSRLARRAQRARLPAAPDAAHAGRHGAASRRGGRTR